MRTTPALEDIFFSMKEWPPLFCLNGASGSACAVWEVFGGELNRGPSPLWRSLSGPASKQALDHLFLLVILIMLFYSLIDTFTTALP